MFFPLSPVLRGEGEEHLPCTQGRGGRTSPLYSGERAGVRGRRGSEADSLTGSGRKPSPLSSGEREPPLFPHHRHLALPCRRRFVTIPTMPGRSLRLHNPHPVKAAVDEERRDQEERGGQD